eukprot:3238458-Prymnesium_polylepis.1
MPDELAGGRKGEITSAVASTPSPHQRYGRRRSESTSPKSGFRSLILAAEASTVARPRRPGLRVPMPSTSAALRLRPTFDRILRKSSASGSTCEKTFGGSRSLTRLSESRWKSKAPLVPSERSRRGIHAGQPPHRATIRAAVFGI